MVSKIGVNKGIDVTRNREVDRVSKMKVWNLHKNCGLNDLVDQRHPCGQEQARYNREHDEPDDYVSHGTVR